MQKKNMCWNAPVSFASFGVGTFLNILSYWWLVRRASPAAPLVLAWQYALLMQIPEGIAHLQLERRSDIEAVSRVAFFLNVTQPIALFVALRIGPVCVRVKYAHVALFLYVVVLLADVRHVWDAAASIAPSEGCRHLNLGYWDTTRGFVYVFVSLFVISEFPLWYWVCVNSAIFVITLLVSFAFYSCGLGSVWCWMVSASGLILVAAHETHPYIGSRTRVIYPIVVYVRRPQRPLARRVSMRTHRSSV